MLKKYVISGAKIFNEGISFVGNLLVENGIIVDIYTEEKNKPQDAILIDGRGKYLIPGVIDDQVHFREPGLTHKADIETESRAAVAGGITSFMEMPNTVPNTLNQELLEEKYLIASKKSLANYSFYMGASNDNIEEVLKTDPSKVCGIKVFMGASTGNMLVDNVTTLEHIFKYSPTLVAVHCEDEATIKNNLLFAREQYGDDIPPRMHPVIRSREACYKSSNLAISLAKKHKTRLHVLHMSTADELKLLSNEPSSSIKRITAEVCVHHLWFTDEDYNKLGNRIKWNPSIKSIQDKDALLDALKSDRIDVIATDHAPHTIDEKQLPYLKCPSGGPLVQHSLVAMLEKVKDIDLIVKKMCHNPALIFGIEKRGFIRKGYHADFVLIDPNKPWIVKPDNILYKCGWSPFEGIKFKHSITHTFIGGHLAWNNGVFDDSIKGSRLYFKR